MTNQFQLCEQWFPSLASESDLKRLLVVVSAALLLAPGVARSQAGIGDPAQNWAEIQRCAALDGAAARHACVDVVLRRTGVLSDARVVRETREEFGIERRDVEQRAAAVAAAAPTARPAPLPAPAPRIDEISTTIASVREIGFQRIRVVTTDGSVWDQSQARTFTAVPKAGDPFVVERALSGFRCQFARSSLYRCERTQ